MGALRRRRPPNAVVRRVRAACCCARAGLQMVGLMPVVPSRAYIYAHTTPVSCDLTCCIYIYRPALFRTQGMEYYSIPEATICTPRRATALLPLPRVRFFSYARPKPAFVGPSSGPLDRGRRKTAEYDSSIDTVRQRPASRAAVIRVHDPVW
jgi:hypothetical protein